MRRPPKSYLLLRFCSEVLRLEHLHYGLWEKEQLTLAQLKVAQQRLTEHLVNHIGPGVRSILDVGCGVGQNALRLRELGFHVQGLTPDSYQKQVFHARTGLDCHLARFEDLRSTLHYDLVFMVESCQFVPPSVLFQKVKEVAPGGQLLIADWFCLYKGDKPLTTSGHLLDAFQIESEGAGFKLVHKEDLTEKVAPTLDLARMTFESWVLPIVRLMVEELQERKPLWFRVGKWLTRKDIQRLDKQLVLIDSAAFRRAKRYMVFDFRVPGID